MISHDGGGAIHPTQDLTLRKTEVQPDEKRRGLLLRVGI